jgi:3-oxoadipate enol-lactonase
MQPGLSRLPAVRKSESEVIVSMETPTPVVLLHGFPLNSRMWARERALLANRAVLAPDFPGFGGRPPGPETLDGFAEVVMDEMDQAGIDQAVVVGLSMGGYVAFRLLARSPARVVGLILADTRAGADDEAGRMKRTAQAERVRREGVAWMPEALLPAFLGETTRRERPAVVEAVRGWIADANPEGVARALLAMRDRPDSTSTLKDVAVPVLALVGEEDALTPVAESRRIAESVPDGRLVLIPGAGHLSNLENPEAFGRELVSFLDGMA